MNACKNESPRALDSRRLLKIMWTGTYFLHFPAPKSTHNFPDDLSSVQALKLLAPTHLYPPSE